MGIEPETTPDLEHSETIEFGAQGGVLRVVYPTELNLEIGLGAAPLVIGRGDPLDSPPGIPDSFMSRRHVRFSCDDALGRHFVEDLDSRNGSALDGVALAPGQRMPLVEGSVLRLGRTLAVYDRHVVSDVEGHASSDAIPGCSSAIRRLRAQVVKAAPEPAPVLIIGPTGVGKERIAREIHRLSGRPGEMVSINAAELSEHLVESQLFGHVRGAFTGAASSSAGLFRAAHRGTLFLDEVGELPLPLQAKLLRVLEEGEVRPVGSTSTVTVDVRVVAATNVDLEQSVAQGRFRSDLYARLFQWTLRVPPLSERRSDILLWLERMHLRWAMERGVGGDRALKLSSGAAEELLLHAWPLNLREVRRVALELAMNASEGRVFSSAEVRAILASASGAPSGRVGLEAPASVSLPPSTPAPPPPGWVETTPIRASAPPSAPPEPAVQPSPPPSATSVPPAPTRARRPKKPPPPESAEELLRVLEETGSVRGAAKRYERDRRQIYRWLDEFGIKR